MFGVELIDIVMAVLFILSVMLALTFSGYLIWRIWELITVMCKNPAEKDRSYRCCCQGKQGGKDV